MRSILLALLLTGCGGRLYDYGPSLNDFCSREPEHRLCEVQAINEAGNAQFKLHADQYDIWHTTNPLGDCEDYALWKYQALYEAGFEPNLVIYSRFVAGVRTLHAVTTVEVDGVIWVLDNETDTIRRKSRTERVGAVEL